MCMARALLHTYEATLHPGFRAFGKRRKRLISGRVMIFDSGHVRLWAGEPVRASKVPLAECCHRVSESPRPSCQAEKLGTVTFGVSIRAQGKRHDLATVGRHTRLVAASIAISGLGGRAGRHVPALSTGAVGLAPVELLVGAGDGVLPVVADVLDALVKLGAALLAVPGEAILLLLAPLALEDQHEGIGRESRRMRRPRRAVDDLALADDGHLFLAIARAVVEVHVPLDHEHDLVAGVAVELAAVLAAARHEGDAVGRLPQDGVGPGGVADGGHDLTEVDGSHLVHGRLPPVALVRFPRFRTRAGERT